VAPDFQRSQVLIRVFSEPQVMCFQTDIFSIFVFSQVNSQRKISIFKDFSKKIFFLKRDSRITKKLHNYPPGEGRPQAQLQEFTGQFSSPEGDFQIILIQRVISRDPDF